MDSKGSEQIFNCSFVTDAQRYGYAYNSNLSNKPYPLVYESSQTVWLYETSVLDRNAYGIVENRALRHTDGGYYAFADGHVKFFDKTKTPNFRLKP